MEPVRELLEEWFASYPSSERGELRARLYNDFHAGFFELFLHAYFTRNTFTLDPHPSVPGSSKRPDFLAVKNNCDFYLEATIARDLSDEDTARQRVRNQLLDAINSTDSPNFFLALQDFEVTPGRQPAARKLKSFLERELPKHNPDDVASRMSGNSLNEGPLLEFQDETILVRITLIPRSPEARGRPGIRPIGIYPIESHSGGADPALKQSLSSKATRYGELDRPYVVAVNYIGEWGPDQDDILNALFGTLQFTFSMRHPDPIPSRKPDGLFIGPAGPWNTRVSAVIVSNVYPWSIPRARLELYHNPWATRPLDRGAMPMRQAAVVRDALEWRDGVRLMDVFGLSENWPDEPAA